MYMPDTREKIQIRHKFNFLKFLIMWVLFDSDRPLTAKEIAEKIHVPAQNVSQALYSYHKHRYHYFRRLQPARGSGTNAYRYNINKRGVEYYLQYVKRVKLGFDLNLRRHVPRRMSTFSGMKVIDPRKAQDRTITFEEAKPYYHIRVMESESSIEC